MSKRKWRYSKQTYNQNKTMPLICINSARARELEKRMNTKICADQGQIRSQDKLDANQPKMSNNFKQFTN